MSYILNTQLYVHLFTSLRKSLCRDSSKSIARSKMLLAVALNQSSKYQSVQFHLKQNNFFFMSKSNKETLTIWYLNWMFRKSMSPNVRSQHTLQRFCKEISTIISDVENQNVILYSKTKLMKHAMQNRLPQNGQFDCPGLGDAKVTLIRNNWLDQ